MDENEKDLLIAKLRIQVEVLQDSVKFLHIQLFQMTGRRLPMLPEYVYEVL